MFTITNFPVCKGCVLGFTVFDFVFLMEVISYVVLIFFACEAFIVKLLQEDLV